MTRAGQLRVLGATVLLVVLLYVVPVEPDANSARLAVRIVLSVLAVGTVAVIIVWQVRRQIAADEDELSLEGLAVALVAGVTVFALADYVMAVSSPSQFVDLNTRTDALYFALSTLLTVGFGDVHASGTWGRVLVIVQMIFNIGVLATGASLLFNQASRRMREHRRGR